MSSPASAPTPSFLKRFEGWAVKASAIASIVAGAVTGAQHALPVSISAILAAVGPVVYLVERYWHDVRKAL